MSGFFTHAWFWLSAIPFVALFIVVTGAGYWLTFARPDRAPEPVSRPQACPEDEDLDLELALAAAASG